MDYARQHPIHAMYTAIILVAAGYEAGTRIAAHGHHLSTGFAFLAAGIALAAMPAIANRGGLAGWVGPFALVFTYATGFAFADSVLPGAAAWRHLTYLLAAAAFVCTVYAVLAELRPRPHRQEAH